MKCGEGEAGGAERVSGNNGTRIGGMCRTYGALHFGDWNPVLTHGARMWRAAGAGWL